MKYQFCFILIIVVAGACSSNNERIISKVEENKLISKYEKEMSQSNYKEAYNTLNNLVYYKSDFAKNEMGYFYENGLHVNKDMKKAISLYAEAGNNDYIPAVYNIGRLRLESNHGAEAFSILKKVASNDYAPAINLIGVMYNNGEYVAKDLNKALSYYSKAASLGNPDAQFNLGQMYFYGEGVKQNYKTSFYWYDASAKQDYDFAKIQLATLYYKGYGVKRDVGKAIDIIQEMAENGDTNAIYNIRLYYKAADDLTGYEYWDKKCQSNIACTKVD
ncbi:tetratricopeptide repeat protein [Acinetobacter gyllenbergii]|uniref:tetratricopeptide repeat protein n=1 Tax=Acinetobacter gyllenbergii TaxID=134534 RepID=UPI00241DDCBB|nr:tetratricopeptide repeat protein [Acinetobacter gyllenbergii]